jgi:DNA-directed RNA polymerase subunit RPC12/RpoP
MPCFLQFSEETNVPGAAAQNGKKSKSTITIIDLTKIDGDGDISCPSCGVKISPEDESEEVYTIIEEKVNGELLEELTIQCNACSTKICLTGFPALDMNEA